MLVATNLRTINALQIAVGLLFLSFKNLNLRFFSQSIFLPLNQKIKLQKHKHTTFLVNRNTDCSIKVVSKYLRTHLFFFR